MWVARGAVAQRKMPVFAAEPADAATAAATIAAGSLDAVARPPVSRRSAQGLPGELRGELLSWEKEKKNKKKLYIRRLSHIVIFSQPPIRNTCRTWGYKG